MAEAVRVLIADDQALLRGSFRLLIDSTPGMEAVGEAGDGAVAVELARELRPDLVLMDLRMPVMDGIAATRQICSDPTLAGVRVLALTMFDMDEYVYPALQAGASGFMLKDVSPTDLIAGIRVIATGEECWRRRSRAASSRISPAATNQCGRRRDLSGSPSVNRRCSC